MNCRTFTKVKKRMDYTLHKTLGTYHSFGLMSNFKTDKIKHCGDSFEEFVQLIS